MKILYLGPPSPLVDFLGAVQTEERITPDDGRRFGLIVSYNYRHILKRGVLDVCRAINLHISMLPWNKGADPNLWSWIENTPKGVSIHYIDEGIDTGDLIVQRQVSFADNDTLRSSYAKLQREIQSLFVEAWPTLLDRPRIPHSGGSFHFAKDKEPYLHLLTEGWDTPVYDFFTPYTRKVPDVIFPEL